MCNVYGSLRLFAVMLLVDCLIVSGSKVFSLVILACWIILRVPGVWEIRVGWINVIGRLRLFLLLIVLAYLYWL